MVANKHTQAEANYGRGDPVSHCGICIYYRGSGTCSQVKGRVSPYGLSDIFQAENNPFGKTLAPNEIKAIQAMAANASDRSGAM
jgi:hypothetical protein